MTNAVKNPDSAEARLAWQVAQTMLSREGAGPAWGLTIEAADLGYSRVSMRLTPAMLNGHGNAHGGMIFALADAAFAYACNSRNVATVAQNCAITFLAPGLAGERLVAEAREVSIVGRSGAYAVTIAGEDGRIIASMQGHSRSLGQPVLEGL